jgi:hypothetical protein
MRDRELHAVESLTDALSLTIVYSTLEWTSLPLLPPLPLRRALWRFAVPPA